MATTARPGSENPESDDVAGLDAVCKVLGGFLVLFTVWGLPISFGAFQLYYLIDYLPTYSSSTISWIGTTQGFFLIVTGMISGPLFDLGYYRLLMWLGTALTVFGLMMLSLSGAYYQILLSQGICVGAGCGLLYLPSLSLLGTCFKRRRAIAMGVATSGIGIGGIIYTITFQRLIQITTFGWTTRTLGFISLFTLSTAILSFGNPKASAAQSRSIFDRTALRDPLFLFFAASQLFVFLGYIVPLIIIPTVARVAFDASNSLSISVLLVTHATSAVGRIFAAVATSWIPIMPLWIASCISSGILCFACIAIEDLSAFWAFAALYGFFTGAVISLPPSIFPRLCPDRSKIGTRMGMSWSVTGVAYLVGTPAATALTDLKSANFTGPLSWAGGMLMFGSTFLCVLWYKLPQSTE